VNVADVQTHLWLSGRVQGVAFRYYTRHEARRIGVTGWVRNLPDGRVEVVIRGKDDQVRALVDWCRHGPPGARVDHVDMIKSEAVEEFQGFEITY
jgi:acylphosphatase